MRPPPMRIAILHIHKAMRRRLLHTREGGGSTGLWPAHAPMAVGPVSRAGLFSVSGKPDPHAHVFTSSSSHFTTLDVQALELGSSLTFSAAHAVCTHFNLDKMPYLFDLQQGS